MKAAAVREPSLQLVNQQLQISADHRSQVAAHHSRRCALEFAPFRRHSMRQADGHSGEAFAEIGFDPELMVRILE